MARRAAERQSKRRRLLDCLDPSVAKTYEDKKTLYEWKVEAEIFRPAKGSEPARMEKIEKQVVAQNDGDAWSMFCDVIKEWPSRRDTNPTITKLRKRTLRDLEPDAELN